jgi:hypoxanthine-guanine phosphoribosyltransferase
MSNIMNVVETLNIIEKEKTKDNMNIINIKFESDMTIPTILSIRTGCNIASLSSLVQEFEVKHEGKYLSFYPYRSSMNSTNPILTFDKIPEKVFGKILIHDLNTITMLYKTVKKKYIRIKCSKS